MPGGSFIGALVSGYLTEKLGRKKAIQIGCAIWIIGSIISCASQSIGMLIAGRFINGISVGICSAQVPVYVSELAPPSKRGRVVGSQQWAITWGILIMYYISVSTVRSSVVERRVYKTVDHFAVFSLDGSIELDTASTYTVLHQALLRYAWDVR
jgi:MFS family permease